MIEQPLPLVAAIAGITALAFWLDRRFGWASKLGASLLVILFGALLSNLGLVPAASPVYDVLAGPVTSLAIAWLLLAVDLRDLAAVGPRMLVAFGIAVVATTVGAFTAFAIFADEFAGEAWKLAGVMTGTYSGGSLNFVSVGRALGLPDSLFTAATAADNVLTAAWMGATLALPAWLGRLYPAPPPAPARTGAGEEAHAAQPAAASLLGPAPLAPWDLAILLAAGLGLVLAAQVVAAVVPGVPAVIWLTTIALAAAQLPAVRRLRGALQLGALALNLFFAVIGIGSRVGEIARVGIEVFWFTAVVVAVHGLLTYGGARLARLDAETTSVASQAAVGGPSTALALAIARGRRELALPGVLAGLLGYAVGNYAGLAVAYAARALAAG